MPSRRIPEETPRQTQNILENLQFSSGLGIPRHSPGGAGGSGQWWKWIDTVHVGRYNLSLSMLVPDGFACKVIRFISDHGGTDGGIDKCRE